MKRLSCKIKNKSKASRSGSTDILPSMLHRVLTLKKIVVNVEFVSKLCSTWVFLRWRKKNVLYFHCKKAIRRAAPQFGVDSCNALWKIATFYSALHRVVSQKLTGYGYFHYHTPLRPDFRGLEKNTMLYCLLILAIISERHVFSTICMKYLR